MRPTDEVMTSFYQHLGELFYAIAKVDGVVRKEEEAVLKKIVEQEWKDLEDSQDEFHSDASFQIISVFDFLNEGFDAAEEWFNDFKAFKKLHEQLFTPKMNALIMRTADAVASSFAKKNKSELVLLNRLRTLLVVSVA